MEAYPPLAAIANQFEAALDTATLHPADLAGLLAVCRRRGQTKPTPLLLHYEAGGYNCLHQDLYGDVVFPLQLTCFLSRPRLDYEGGAFLLTRATPNLLDVLVVALAFTGIFGAAARLVSGDSFAEAWAQVGVRTPALVVLTFIVAVPAVIALQYLFLLVIGALWVALVGFSIPVAVLERDPDVSNAFDRIAFSLLRSMRLARAEYLHALGVVAALPIAPGPHRITAHMPDGRVLERDVVIDERNRHVVFR